jgi:hypothetical protein
MRISYLKDDLNRVMAEVAEGLGVMWDDDESEYFPDPKTEVR